LNGLYQTWRDPQSRFRMDEELDALVACQK
jgi:hypothetical protein